MKIKRLAEFGLSFMLSISSLLMVAVPTAHAATLTWTGAQSDSMNDGLNWGGGVVAPSGDTLVFPASANFQMPNNDLAGLSVAGITFNGDNSGASSKSYTLTGNGFTLTGSVLASMTGAGGDHQILTDVTLGQSLGFVTTGVNTLVVGDTGTTLDLGANTLTLDPGGGSILLNGEITGSGNIVKNGDGKVVLNLTNSTGSPYSGSYQINSGEFEANDNTASNITLSGGTLKGTGSVGSITMSDGSVAPGTSPGCLASGDLVYTGGTEEIEIAGTTACAEYDQQQVTGSVDLGSATTLNVSLLSGFIPAVGDEFVIIDNDTSADAVTGTFSGLAEGATFTEGAATFSISYAGGDGNDVVLTVDSVEAVAEEVAPDAPDTGFALIISNPLAILVATILAAGAILVIARRLQVRA